MSGCACAVFDDISRYRSRRPSHCRKCMYTCHRLQTYVKLKIGSQGKALQVRLVLIWGLDRDGLVRGRLEGEALLRRWDAGDVLQLALEQRDGPCRRDSAFGRRLVRDDIHGHIRHRRDGQEEPLESAGAGIGCGGGGGLRGW